MVLVDAVVRLLPGVLGDAESAHFESFCAGSKRLLDHPHYTRPRIWQGQEVPSVLISGDHGGISAWRAQQSLLRTQERRPDLLEPTTTQSSNLLKSSPPVIPETPETQKVSKNPDHLG